MNTFNAYNFLLLYIIIILSVAKLDFYITFEHTKKLNKYSHLRLQNTFEC
jgi:hypothetical protein